MSQDRHFCPVLQYSLGLLLTSTLNYCCYRAHFQSEPCKTSANLTLRLDNWDHGSVLARTCKGKEIEKRLRNECISLRMNACILNLQLMID